MRRSGNSALLVLVVLLAACFPYGFAGGGLPSHIKTIAVLPFDNQTTASALQQEILPLTEQLHQLRSDLSAAAAEARNARQEETAVLEQRSRLEALLEENRALESATGERVRQVQALTASLEHSIAAKDSLLAELTGIEKRQREAVSYAESAADQIKRVDGMYRDLDGRRAQLAFAEKKMAAVERRLDELGQTATTVDDKISALADRESVIDTVRQAVDAVHDVSAKSKADLEYVAEHREAIASVRHLVEALLSTAAEAEDKIGAIESRRKTIDAVHVKANLIANLLEDVRVNLEALGEQKAVVEHVAVKLARLEFVMQEAQNTLRTLQHERELAERIEQNITQIRARTALGPEGKTPATA